jgi:hypothetical protein
VTTAWRERRVADKKTHVRSVLRRELDPLDPLTLSSDLRDHCNETARLHALAK